ncbi:hypothetical protein PHISP_05328 [Aspergillus sp. HF37]|nr:hypothetical protein PHISP_05328 [Aspergillus sp. HF37]
MPAKALTHDTLVDTGAIPALPVIANGPKDDDLYAKLNPDDAMLCFPDADIVDNWQFMPGDTSPFLTGDAAELACADAFQLANATGFDAAYLEQLNGDPVDDAPPEQLGDPGEASNQPFPYTLAEMPAGFEMTEQPAKRGTKRSAPDSPASDNPPEKKAKRPRRKKNEPEPDYSAIIRKQVKNATRTGQACDRCKVKRMKCDSEPMGCTICQLYGRECRVTDLTTGTTMTRGEVLRVKQDLDLCREQIRQLNARIRDLTSQIERYKQQRLGEPEPEPDCLQDVQVGQSHLCPWPSSPAALTGQAPGTVPGNPALLQDYHCPSLFVPVPVPVPVPPPAPSACNIPNNSQALPHPIPTALPSLHGQSPMPAPLPTTPRRPPSVSAGVSGGRPELNEFERLWARRAPGLCGQALLEGSTMAQEALAIA